LIQKGKKYKGGETILGNIKCSFVVWCNWWKFKAFIYWQCCTPSKTETTTDNQQASATWLELK